MLMACTSPPTSNFQPTNTQLVMQHWLCDHTPCNTWLTVTLQTVICHNGMHKKLIRGMILSIRLVCSSHPHGRMTRASRVNLSTKNPCCFYTATATENNATSTSGFKLLIHHGKINQKGGSYLASSPRALFQSCIPFLPAHPTTPQWFNC